MDIARPVHGIQPEARRLDYIIGTSGGLSRNFWRQANSKSATRILNGLDQSLCHLRIAGIHAIRAAQPDPGNLTSYIYFDTRL